MWLFTFLQKIVKMNLQATVAPWGGGNRLLHDGRKVTESVEGERSFAEQATTDPKPANGHECLKAGGSNLGNSPDTFPERPQGAELGLTGTGGEARLPGRGMTEESIRCSGPRCGDWFGGTAATIHEQEEIMAYIHPFRGVRPRPDVAAQVASPPYDVLDSEEARALAADNPHSFMHVVKPEIDLDPSVGLYDEAVYKKGAENLNRLRGDGVLIQDEAPCLYLYRQIMGDHTQTGLVAGASVEEYENDRIKKHESTRTDKEQDRIRHIETQNAQSGPVFLTYRSRPEIKQQVERLQQADPTYDFVADDGIRHTLWVVSEPSDVAALQEAFGRVDTLYVADGHHRSAAATAVCRKRRESNPSHDGTEEYNFFLSVIFPHDEMQILPYNRVVRDLAGYSVSSFIDALHPNFSVGEAEAAAPTVPHQFGMYLDGRWHRLSAARGSYDASDPVGSLDVSILQEGLLRPLLGIQNPRTDKRIDFVGGIRGTGELERRCQDGWKIAFALYPTTVDQLLSVADAGDTMPPKSTWFEPKLRSGLVVHVLD